MPATYLLAITVDSDARLRAGVAACLKCLGKRAGISTSPLVRLPDGLTVAELLEAGVSGASESKADLSALRQERDRLLDLCRQQESAVEERDIALAELREIGRLVGCEHTEGLVRCVLDEVARLQGIIEGLTKGAG